MEAKSLDHFILMGINLLDSIAGKGAIAGIATIWSGRLVALGQDFKLLRKKLDMVLYKPKIRLTKKITNETEGYVDTLLRFPDPDTRLGSRGTQLQLNEKNAAHVSENHVSDRHAPFVQSPPSTSSGATGCECHSIFRVR